MSDSISDENSFKYKSIFCHPCILIIKSIAARLYLRRSKNVMPSPADIILVIRWMPLFYRDSTVWDSGMRRERRIGDMNSIVMKGSRLSIYCRQLVNISPMEYLNHCRLKKAANSLKTDFDKTITEIAFENGFNSSEYFATCFRQQFHCNPRDFRKRHM